MEEQGQPQPVSAQSASTCPVPIKQNNKLLITIAGLVFLLMAGGLIYLGYQNYQLQQRLDQLSKQQNNQIITSPTPTAKGEVSTFTGTVLPVSFEYSNKLKVYESTRPDQGFGEGIHVAYDYPDNPPRFLHIDNTLPPYFGELAKLKVGEKYQDKTITEEDIIATRLSDKTIGGKQATSYEWNKQWELPGPVREYFISFNDKYVRIRLTYSNVTGANTDNPMYTFDYVTAFDQIISTFRFSD
ncbi:MAG: hypothetical protein HY376_00755 [Candidatus Blackburnbacteria bacterium]|nr:hypothetical protein [Candidatus Blackburnbacteria bacterium]